jgi:hypothetical protein
VLGIIINASSADYFLLQKEKKSLRVFSLPLFGYSHQEKMCEKLVHIDITEIIFLVLLLLEAPPIVRAANFAALTIRRLLLVTALIVMQCLSKFTTDYSVLPFSSTVSSKLRRSSNLFSFGSTE